ncbi:MAG: DALR domain-containing protein, partial [bacterium]
YFDTSKLPDYGKLAKLDIEGLRAGSRIEMVEGKKNSTDFALWKFTPNGVRRQMEWDSPWAPPGSRGEIKGFPGWHIECSAMSRKYLGEQFDIHCGGIDHIPVHHTNEIAQSEAAFGKIPARFWLHNEFLLIDGGKMAKSEGDILTIQTLIDKGFDPLAYRYLNLTAHYRSKLNFTWESLKAAQSALLNLYQIFGEYPDGGKISSAYQKDFQDAINDDLNIPEALAVVWKLVKDEKISEADKKETLLDFDKVFALGLDKIKKAEVPPKIINLSQKREAARAKKDWAKADELRQKIEQAGWQIEDTEKGSKITKK